MLVFAEDVLTLFNSRGCFEKDSCDISGAKYVQLRASGRWL